MEEKSKTNTVPDIFNKIYHVPRLNLRISIEEACLMDTVDKMSAHQYRDYPLGWCYASKGYFARFLEMNRVSIQRMVRRLVEYGLLVKGNPVGGNRVVPLRTCDKWREQVRESEAKKNSFSHIYHMPRSKLGLSCGEYCLLDSLCWLQEYNTFVWHKGTKRWLADRLCIPYSTFANLFQRMRTRGFLKRVEQYIELNGDLYAYEVVEGFKYILSESLRQGVMTLDQAIKSVRSKAEINAKWVTRTASDYVVRV